MPEQRNSPDLGQTTAPLGKIVPIACHLRQRGLLRLNPFLLVRRFADDFLHVVCGARQVQRNIWSPRVEVRRHDKVLVLSAALPGVNEHGVKIEVTEEGLVIRGECPPEYEDVEGAYCSEYRYRRFRRSIPLPPDAKMDKAKAHFKDGVLEISIPSTGSRQKRRQAPLANTGGKPSLQRTAATAE